MQKVKHELVKVSVNVIIKKGNTVLMVQQNRPEKIKGKWTLPGGKVDLGESFLEAVDREVYEETGLKARDVKEIGVIHERPNATVKHFFTASAETVPFKFNPDEIISVSWQPLDKVLGNKIDLRKNWIIQAISMLD